MYYLAFPIGFIFGLFASSQILYPIFHSLPAIVRLKKAGMFKKEPPLWYTLITPVIWISLSLIVVWIFEIFFSTTVVYFLVGYGISAFIVIIQIPGKNEDLDDDFRDSYRNYLKDSRDSLDEFDKIITDHNMTIEQEDQIFEDALHKALTEDKK